MTRGQFQHYSKLCDASSLEYLLLKVYLFFINCLLINTSVFILDVIWKNKQVPKWKLM